jgi:hypothetical protein
VHNSDNHRPLFCTTPLFFVALSHNLSTLALFPRKWRIIRAASSIVHKSLFVRIRSDWRSANTHQYHMYSTIQDSASQSHRHHLIVSLIVIIINTQVKSSPLFIVIPPLIVC